MADKREGESLRKQQLEQMKETATQINGTSPFARFACILIKGIYFSH